MHRLIENNRSRIEALCQRYHVKELYVFGSITRDDFHAQSDVDFLVNYDDAITEPAERVAIEDGLKEDLERLLGREVDLIQYNRIRNKYLRHFINQDKKLLYAAA